MTVHIAYTEYGVPHITADTFADAGKGAGYSMAEQYGSLLADRWLTVRGRRCLRYGEAAEVGTGPTPGARNLQSDMFWRLIRNAGVLKDAVTSTPPLGPSTEARALFGGVAEGYNRYLDSHHATVEWAAHAESIGEEEVFGQALHWNLFRSSVSLIPEIVAAAPPGEELDDRLAVGSGCEAVPDESNMIALGGDVSSSGGGMLYANPHWYWNGPDSFREMHLRIGEDIDVYGSVVPGLPLIMSGFSADTAFAGTSSYSPRFTVYRLELDPADPTRYLYDGEYLPMERRVVECPTGDADSGSVEKIFYSTRHGLMLGGTRYPWGRKHAYCMREVGFSVRWVEQQLQVMTAQTCEAADAASRRILGVGWRNLIVTDRHGDVLYADRTGIPNVTDEQYAASVETTTAAAEWNGVRVAVLDGADPGTEWTVDEDAPVPGIIGPARLPLLSRRDYVANENDSHWSNHGQALLEGYPQVVGSEGTPRTLRTRNGLNLVDELITEEDRSVALSAMRRKTGRNTVWSATLWCDEVCDLLEREDSEEFGRAVAILRQWDRRELVDSRGAILWRRFFAHFAGSDRVAPPECFAVPFDRKDPRETPRGLGAREAVPEAMRAAMGDLEHLGLDVTVGDAQFVTKNGRRFPIPGGPHEGGQYQVIRTSRGFDPRTGYAEVDNGTGFQLWVDLTEAGPQAESVLAYSQSAEPTSAHFSDQTLLVAEGRTKRVRFDPQDVAVHTIVGYSL